MKTFKIKIGKKEKLMSAKDLKDATISARVLFGKKISVTEVK